MIIKQIAWRSIVCLSLVGGLEPVLAFNTGMDPVYSSSGRPYGKTTQPIGEGITPGDRREYTDEQLKKEEDDQLRSIFFPTLSTGLTWDDNIFRSEKSQKSSTIFNLRPNLLFQTSRRANRLYGGYKGNYAWYSNDPTGRLDYNDHNLNIGADHIGSKNYYGAYAEYQRGHDQPGGIDTNASQFDKWGQYRVKGWWQYGADTARLNFRLDGEWDDRTYDRFTVNDVTTAGLAGLLKVRISGKSRGVLEGGLRRYEYDNSNQDADRYYVRVGLHWDATAKTRGIFTWGYEDFSPDNAGDALGQNNNDPVFGVNEDYTGTTWKAAIRWEPRDRDTVLFNSSRGARLSNSIGSHKISTRYDVAWTHLWSSRFRSHLGYALGDDDYRGANRQDNLQELQLSGSYTWRRNLQLVGSWFYEERDSNIALQSYDRNLLELRVDWEY